MDLYVPITLARLVHKLENCLRTACSIIRAKILTVDYRTTKSDFKNLQGCI